jgi:putative cell wall-binding protein
MVDVRRRGGRFLAVVSAVTLSGVLAAARPAAALAGDTITDSANTGASPLEIQQATRVANTAAGTMTITITTYAPFTDPQTNFNILIDTNHSGSVNIWIPVRYDTATNSLLAGIGLGGSFHLDPVTVSRPAPNSVAATFPLAAIQGSTTFDWLVESIVPASSPGGTAIIDNAPDTPTTILVAPVRVAGTDRIDTAIQASFFLPGTAGAVVLARDDAFPDALGGAPLAAAKDAPLLLTDPASLDPRTLAEIKRVLPAGGTVYLLGGLNALSQAVENAVKAAGYTTVRYAGTDRYGTDLLVVQQGLGNPTTVLLTTGANFPDALTAGAAAAHLNGGVLLTNDTQLPPAVAAYLQANTTDTVYAVGGPAAAADPSATAIVGTDRYDTGAKVATTFFKPPLTFGVASGANFPDALAGGATIGLVGDSPLLLTDPNTLSAPTAAFLAANKSAFSQVASWLFGGTSAVSDNVRAAIGVVLFG